jgi:hypothetical protein
MVKKKKEKRGKRDTNTLDAGILWETLKYFKMRKNSIGPGIWREIVNNVKNTHCRTWIMARNLKNVENENLTW